MLTIHNTDALTALREIESGSVQTCITSPPYWGLRDYGLKPLVWDERGAADLFFGKSYQSHTSVPCSCDCPSEMLDDHHETCQQVQAEKRCRHQWVNAFCSLCGAWFGCLGLEPTPELYVQHVIQIFRKVRRVLRDDGTLWINLGDSYNNQPGQRKQGVERNDVAGWKQQTNTGCLTMGSRNVPYLKPKDLVGIPWMVAFALRADGWYLRSDIIWSKPNPMPESVTDRPTKAHEYIFLLSKNQKYFYDHEAIKEPSVYFDDDRKGRAQPGHKTMPTSQRNGIRPDKQRGHSRRHAGFNDRWDAMTVKEQCSGMRNKRSVWEIAPLPFSDAHFATFPPALVTPCILAGSKSGDFVLDPFAGSGTVGKVAIELGRRAVLIEPNPEYVKMIERRTTTTMGLPL